MPPDQALATKGTARAREGNAVTNTCPQCCGACPAWRPLTGCANQATCFGDPPPVPPTVYICQTVRCGNGEKLRPGTVVFLDGRCWTVGLGTVPNPPLNQRVTGLASVACITSCNDPLCPVGELWYPSVPCVEGVEPIWVCGVSQCEVRDCHTIQPVNGVPTDQLPPGARTFRLSDLGPPRNSCCVDSCGNCSTSPLLGFTAENDPAGPGCQIGVPFAQLCCCDGLRRIHVVRMHVFQRVFNPPPNDVLNGTVELTMTHEIPDGPNCYRIGIHVQRRGFARPDEDFDGTSPTLVCPACGGWPPFAPGVDGTVEHGNQLTGGAGGGIGFCGGRCNGHDEGPDGWTVIVTTFQRAWTCNGMSSRYATRSTFNPTGTIIETSCEGELRADDDSCGAPCGGRINNGQPVGDVQDAPGGPGGAGFPAGDVRGFL